MNQTEIDISNLDARSLQVMKMLRGQRVDETLRILCGSIALVLKGVDVGSGSKEFESFQKVFTECLSATLDLLEPYEPASEEQNNPDVDLATFPFSGNFH